MSSAEDEAQSLNSTNANPNSLDKAVRSCVRTNTVNFVSPSIVERHPTEQKHAKWRTPTFWRRLTSNWTKFNIYLTRTNSPSVQTPAMPSRRFFKQLGVRVLDFLLSNFVNCKVLEIGRDRLFTHWLPHWAMPPAATGTGSRSLFGTKTQTRTNTQIPTHKDNPLYGNISASLS
jgi:hypothetical protein